MDPISYTEAQFIFNSKNIKQAIIKMFLSQAYSEQFKEINFSWYKSLSNSKILDDIFSIKRKAVEKQWIT